MEFVGRIVRKEFKGFGVFTGVVNSYDPSTGFFEIVYEDGDSEELELPEIASLLEGSGMVVNDHSNDHSGADEVARKSTRVGRKPKKRRRIEVQGDSGKVSAHLVSDSFLKERGEDILGQDVVAQIGFLETRGKERGVGENLKEPHSVNRNGVRSGNWLNSNDGFDLNDGVNLSDGFNLKDGFTLNVNSEEQSKKNACIDLNLDANDDFEDNLKEADLGVSVVGTQKRGHKFDLNLGLDEEIKNSDTNCEGFLEEKASFHVVEENKKQVIGGGVEKAQMEGDIKNGKGTFLEASGGAQMEAIGWSGENAVGDLRVGLVEDVQNGSCVSGGLKGDDSYGALYAEDLVHPKGKLPDTGTSLDRGYQSNSGSTFKERNRRKRRKLLDNANSCTETMVRRSSRRLATTLSDQIHVSSGATLLELNEAQPSPAISSVLEEKPTPLGREDSEEYCVLPLKLQLPPSSRNMNLDGIPILDLFSVYACLRSFSTLLFLSPFELEEFVESLQCNAPNLLFDSIHVSLLQTLRKHLEFLSNENSQSASNCLRSLNWDLMDLITWPIFMAEYLLTHSSGLKPDFDLCKLKLFESDYYRQPAFVKIEILRCLCDDVIEVEAIMSELNRRALATELNMDTDRSMKIDNTYKSKRTSMDVSGGSCLTEEIVAETTDWNSDECCLCKMDGSLICCDGCPEAYHSRCVGVANSLLPEGDWYCPECMIDKDKPWLKLGKSIRGAELLGVDPYGRLYYSSCGYLLVSDSCNSESSYYYYHRNNLNPVIEVLKSSDTRYIPILGAISKQWNLFVNFKGAKSDVDYNNPTVCSELMKGQIPSTLLLPLHFASSETYVRDERNPPVNSFTSQYSGNTDCKFSVLVNNNPLALNSFVKMENPLTSSEGSAETSQAARIQNFAETGMDGFNKRKIGITNDSEIQGKILSVGDSSLTFTNLDAEQGKNIESSDCGYVSSVKEARKNETSHGSPGTSYMNCYSFARTASLVAEELMRKSSVKITVGSTKSIEDLVSTQLKAISKKATKFAWPNIQNLNADARKEKCGWCFSCKAPDDDRDCFFNMNDSAPEFKSEVVGGSEWNNKSHLVDVMCYILCIEDRLRGFLLGPWLNPLYTKFWRKSVVKASDVASLKHSLLVLESSVRRLALSADWLKHVDSVATMGSASFVSSKHGNSRKRARCSDLEPKPSSKAVAGLSLFWWRGGRLSRDLFNWKVLPRSLASKAARQALTSAAGCTKISGILYPDSSESANRSKYVVWRAAVETSRSVEQLALQVRELDANIRWDDIENTNLLSKMDQFRKSVRPFKKVIIRRKCTEGTSVKYLLDFGKRRIIPDIVVTHGSKAEETSSGRKKYWLEEPHVPLHLLKAFEERRIARRSNMSSGKLPGSCRVMKKTSKKRGFSYLFAKAERSENYRCGHCNKDVLIRESVSCQNCKGFFHKRHVRKSSGAITANCTYTCHKCQDGNSVKFEAKGNGSHKKLRKAPLSAGCCAQTRVRKPTKIKTGAATEKYKRCCSFASASFF